jgi:hypothetical protein
MSDLTDQRHVAKQATPRQNVIQHIQAINKCLGKEYLEGLTNEQLLSETHPVYRADYARLLDVETSGKKILKITLYD